MLIMSRYETGLLLSHLENTDKELAKIRKTLLVLCVWGGLYFAAEVLMFLFGG